MIIMLAVIVKEVHFGDSKIIVFIISLHIKPFYHVLDTTKSEEVIKIEEKITCSISVMCLTEII